MKVHRLAPTHETFTALSTAVYERSCPDRGELAAVEPAAAAQVILVCQDFIERLVFVSVNIRQSERVEGRSDPPCR